MTEPVPTDTPGAAELIEAERWLGRIANGFRPPMELSMRFAEAIRKEYGRRGKLLAMVPTLDEDVAAYSRVCADLDAARARLAAQEPVVAAATEYLNEHDNPAPDYVLRKTLRDRLRSALDDAVRRQQ